MRKGSFGISYLKQTYIGGKLGQILDAFAFAIHLTVTLLTFSALLDPATSDVMKPIHLDDPELYRVWSTPHTLYGYKSYSELGVSHLGNLYAGRSEFPWIVDIRYIDGDADTWSTGNLVTSYTVLVSCRSVCYWVQVKNEFNENRSTFHMHDNVKVNYCSTYLWEDYKYIYYRDYKEDENIDRTTETGTRTVDEVLPHPKCSNNSMLNDLAVLKLSSEIKPIAPVLSYMPIWMDPVVGEVQNVNLDNQVAQRRVCYIASFGRDFINWKNHIVTDYKVKYRVYIENIDPFKRGTNRPCEADERLYAKTVDHIGATVWEEETPFMYCFRTRARVGTVCDHDRGAPLVCDGRVYGLVSRGVDQAYCNNLLPQTFVVAKTLNIQQYYEQFGYEHFVVPEYGQSRSQPNVFSVQLLFAASMLVFCANQVNRS